MLVACPKQQEAFNSVRTAKCKQRSLGCTHSVHPLQLMPAFFSPKIRRRFKLHIAHTRSQRQPTGSYSPKIHILTLVSVTVHGWMGTSCFEASWIWAFKGFESLPDILNVLERCLREDQDKVEILSLALLKICGRPLPVQ